MGLVSNSTPAHISYLKKMFKESSYMKYSTVILVNASKTNLNKSHSFSVTSHPWIIVKVLFKTPKLGELLCVLVR